VDPSNSMILLHRTRKTVLRSTSTALPKRSQNHGAPATTLNSKPRIVSRMACMTGLSQSELRRSDQQGEYAAPSAVITGGVNTCPAPHKGGAPFLQSTRRRTNRFGSGHVSTGLGGRKGAIETHLFQRGRGRRRFERASCRGVAERPVD